MACQLQYNVTYGAFSLTFSICSLTRRTHYVASKLLCNSIKLEQSKLHVNICDCILKKIHNLGVMQ